MSAIQSDVEKLLQHANRSGFLQRKFEEAELPPIFQEREDAKSVEDKTPSSPTSPTKKPDQKKDNKDVGEKEGNNHSKKNVKSTMKKNEKGKSGGESNINKTKQKTTKAASKQESQEEKGNTMPASPKNAEGKGEEKGTKSSEPSSSKASDITTTPADAPPSGSKNIDSIRIDGKGETGATSNFTNQNNGTNSANATPSTGEALSSNNTSEATSVLLPDSANSANVTAPTNSTTPPLSAIVSSSSDGGTVPPTDSNANMDIGGINVTGAAGGLHDGATAPSTELSEDESREYTKEFHDLTPSEVPADHLPVLTWNYQAVINPDIPEQIFGLGDKLDHVAVYKPLCINTADETAFMFQGKTVCGGFNRTQGWLIQYCSVMKESLQKEYLLQMQPEPKPRSWLTENAAQIRWVEGLTVLQVLEKNCGNIAHYSGRILLLQHIIDNIMAYAAPPSRIMNVLIVPTFHIMKRFLYPHNYEFWHKTLLSALIAPSNFTIGTLGNFLYRDSKPRPDGLAMVQLLHNLSMVGSGDEDKGKQYVCFRRVAIPGYLKARFFVNDMEYPSTKPSLQSTAKNAPKVPRDSLRMRERVSALVAQSPKFAKRGKEIVLLDRNGSRRVFGPEAREKVLGMLKKVADEKGYSFKIVSFDKMTFQQQYDVMKAVSIAVGIHGANLVNTMFMPPLAVLLEIFPYGFHHEMYVNGGNAGLKYFAYRMKEGVPFDGPKVYRSVEQCIKLNQKCKVHYRDAVIKVNDEDMAEIERLLREAVDWCDALPSTEGDGNTFAVDSSDSENGNQRRRLRRRRRLLDRQGWG